MVMLQQKPDAPEHLHTSVRLVFWLLLAVVVLMGGWAAYSPLDTVVVATGRVVARGLVQSVQHLEGGIIARINVKEGDNVSQGELLAELRSTASSVDLAELNSSINSLKLDVLRLEQEYAGSETLDIPTPRQQDYTDDQTDQFLRATARREEALQRFNARKQALKSALEVQDSERKALLENKERSEIRLKNLAIQRDILAEQQKIAQELRSEDLTSRFEQLDLLKELAQLDTQIADEKSALSSIAQSLILSDQKKQQIVANFKDSVSKDLSDSQRSLFRLTERRRELQDNVERSVLRAPKSGIVRTVYVSTVGGVIAPGGTLLDIVPQESGVVVEARLTPRDIGLVKVGMETSLKLTSNQATKFGSITGRVTVISPDTVRDRADGPPFYQVQIDTTTQAFVSDDTTYPLVPGVELAVGVVVGQRTVLGYLLDPFQAQFNFALSEV